MPMRMRIRSKRVDHLVEDDEFSPDGGRTWYVCYLPMWGTVSVQQAGTRNVYRIDVPQGSRVLVRRPRPTWAKCRTYTLVARLAASPDTVHMPDFDMAMAEVFARNYLSGGLDITPSGDALVAMILVAPCHLATTRNLVAAVLGRLGYPILEAALFYDMPGIGSDFDMAVFCRHRKNGCILLDGHRTPCAIVGGQQ